MRQWYIYQKTEICLIQHQQHEEQYYQQHQQTSHNGAILQGFK